MLKKLVCTLLYLIPLINFSQDFSQLWEGHFSYLNVIDISRGNDKLYVAAENAVFTYDLLTNEIETISTVNGLSGESISSIHYSDVYGLLLIGYENGLIDIVSNSNNEILTVIDILEKPTIPPTNKRINHFNEFNDLVYISTDYGISIYNLNNLEFGDTYFIGNSGSQIIVKETTIFGDFIYAACANNNGLKKAIHANDNLIDFQEWQTVISGSFINTQTLNDRLYVIGSNNKIYEVINDSLIELFTYNLTPVDFKVVNNNLIVVTRSNVYVYDNDFNLIFDIAMSEEFDTDYTSAIFGSDDQLYIGTKDFGILKTTTDGDLLFEEIHPQGPLLNNSFSVEASGGDLWLTFGDYSISYNPSPVRNRGVSHLSENEWFNIPYDSVFGAKNLNKISINPNNQNQVFISSFQNGILEINDNQPTILHDNTNSGLESLILPNNPNFTSIRVSGSNFDTDGVLWSVTCLVENVLKSYNPLTSQWQSYSFSSLSENPFGTLGYGDLVIDNNGNKWIAGYSYGVVGVKTSGGSAVIKNIIGEAGEGNLPTNYISALQIDNSNQLWIGTSNGLRVVYNTESVFSEQQPRAEEIIILDDGIPKELLYQQFISDIEVDGSNNKWIGTISTGLFYFSENGQETIFHFTKDNSPLPSNNIIDVAIDDSTGKIYIATDKGLVAFKSGGSKPKTDLKNAFVFPNPVRPAFDITQEKVKIKGFSEQVNIKITDIEGNIVAEAQSNTNQRYEGYNLEIDGGTAFWNGKNLANNTVASGVYLVLISDLDTLETKVLKLMVVR